MTRLPFLFVHGWGFDSSIWMPIQAALTGRADALEFGYFGSARHVEVPDHPLIAVGHSFGGLWLLRNLPKRCRGFVAINGFCRFAAAPDFPEGVPHRLVERMIARLERSPSAVVAEFRHRCGTDAPLPEELTPDRLIADLFALRDCDGRETARALDVPFLVLQGGSDAIVSSSMSEASFDGVGNVEHAELGAHGHLLPLSAPQWCAQQLRQFAERIA